MKRIKVLSFTLPLPTLLLSSYASETDDDADRMEGIWRPVKIEPMTSAANEDLSRQVIFWSFQARLLQMEDKAGQHHNYPYRFRIDNGQPTLISPYQLDHESGDRSLTAYESTLGLYGIKNLAPMFRIEKISRQKITLSDEVIRLYFDRF